MRERSGLVRRDHAGGAQRLYRRKAAHDRAARGHVARPLSERDRHSGRKSFGNRGNRDRNSDEERFVEGGTTQEHPRSEETHDGDAEHEHRARERGKSALQWCCRRLRRGSEPRDFPELGLRARRRDDCPRSADGDPRAGVQHRATFRERGFGTDGVCSLFHRSGFTGQQRLVDRQTLGVDDTRVRGHAVSVVDDDKVARNELRRRHDSLSSVADDVRRELASPTQREQRSLRAGLLNEPQDGVEHHDRADNGALEELADCRPTRRRRLPAARRADPRAVALRFGRTVGAWYGR